MGSQWFDTSGNQWRFSTGTQTWQKMVGGRWVSAVVPSGGLSRTQSASTFTEPDPDPTPPDPGQPAPAGSRWIDEGGTLWRFSAGTRTWQKMVGNRWVSAVVPTGGLSRSEVGVVPDVVVIESVGPRGERGDRGPAGPPGTHVQIFQVLPTEYQDGVNDTFTLTDPADLSQAVQVFRNGLMEIPGHGFLVTPTTVTFTTPPLDSDVLTVVYQKAQ